MRVLVYDCSAGISGDMNLAALIDLGADRDILERELSKLNVHGEWKLECRRAAQAGIHGMRVDVLAHEHRPFRPQPRTPPPDDGGHQAASSRKADFRMPYRRRLSPFFPCWRKRRPCARHYAGPGAFSRSGRRRFHHRHRGRGHLPGPAPCGCRFYGPRGAGRAAASPASTA